MSITDRDVAALASGIYAYPGDVPVAWDHFDAGADDGVCWGLKRLPGADVIVLRGSVSLEDWIRDVNALPMRKPIGIVHAGFYAGLEKVWQEARPLLQQPVIVAGHSLGAARAGILTALMIADGVKPLARVVFGEPKPGFMDLAAIINQVPGRSYRNGDDTHHDLVTDLPFSFPPLQFVHPSPIIPVSAEPGPDLFAKLGVFAFHHMPLYSAATPSTPIL